MSQGIILSAGVRQNLLALQNTAQLAASTQNRLATGRKVNTALDNPSSYFTSQALSTRANDLSTLLDQIGQAVQNISAANNGITSITQLVQSAKSIAQQARSTTAATSTYSSVDSSANILSAANLNGSESTATTTGTSRNLEATAIAVTGATVTETLGRNTGTAAFANDAALIAAFNGGGSDGNLQVTVNSRGGTTQTFTIALAAGNATTNTKAGLLSAINTASDGNGHTLSQYVTAAFDGSNHLQLTANDAAENFAVSAGGSGSTATTLTALGVTAGTSNSTDLLSQLSSGAGTTLVLSGTNSDGTAFTSSTVTFGNGAGQVATLQDLNTQIQAAATTSGGAFSAAATPTVSGTSVTGHISITKPAGTGSSVTVGGTVATLSANATLLEGGTAGTVFSTHNSQPTLANLGATLGGGSGGPVSLTSGGTLSFTANGANYNVAIGANDRIGDVVNKLNGSALGAFVNVSKVTDGSGHDHIKIDAKDASDSFTINANGTSAALGLTTNTTTSSVNNSTDLLNLLDTAFGGAGNATGKTLTVAASNGPTQTITFGTGTGQIQTIAQLNTALSGLSGVTASVSAAGALDINVASGTSPTSLAIGGTAAAKLGLTAGTQNGTVLSTTANATRTNLQAQFNQVLTQIDSTARDSSYNGINLLNGDDLKVAFNENSTSSLTIKGTFANSASLGLNQLNGTQFQDNSQIDTIVSTIGTAVTTLASQASTLGSNLTTVQARQTFTKDLISTLQIGSDNLVLADTNEEGASLLALQTRQQLSTTALSLANQANQAVLRLFG
jgi:flagellin